MQAVLSGSEIRVQSFYLNLRVIILFAGLLVGIFNLRAETVYRVKAGDSLSAIARQNGISLSVLSSRNNLRNSESLRVGQVLMIPDLKASHGKSEASYVVKSGDSLALIAKKFDVSISALVQENQIKETNRINVGQRLKIPSAQTKIDTGISSSVQKKLRDIAVAPNRWKQIVIHHSGTAFDTMAGMDRYHRNERHMENGLAYHFVIGNGGKTKEGEIYIGSRWTRQLDGGHLSSLLQNKSSIGICLVGDFNKAPPTEKQLAATRSLVSYLLGRCLLEKRSVKTHREINLRPTQCPGSKFPTAKFLKTLP